MACSARPLNCAMHRNRWLRPYTKWLLVAVLNIAMTGWETVAAHESYIGLVEFGVGLIPAGGGCKEILRRKVNPTMRTPNADVLPVMQDDI